MLLMQQRKTCWFLQNPFFRRRLPRLPIVVVVVAAGLDLVSRRSRRRRHLPRRAKTGLRFAQSRNNQTCMRVASCPSATDLNFGAPFISEHAMSRHKWPSLEALQEIRDAQIDRADNTADNLAGKLHAFLLTMLQEVCDDDFEDDCEDTRRHSEFVPRSSNQA